MVNSQCMMQDWDPVFLYQVAYRQCDGPEAVREKPGPLPAGLSRGQTQEGLTGLALGGWKTLRNFSQDFRVPNKSWLECPQSWKGSSQRIGMGKVGWDRIKEKGSTLLNLWCKMTPHVGG